MISTASSLKFTLGAFYNLLTNGNNISGLNTIWIGSGFVLLAIGIFGLWSALKESTFMMNLVILWWAFENDYTKTKQFFKVHCCSLVCFNFANCNCYNFQHIKRWIGLLCFTFYYRLNGTIWIQSWTYFSNGFHSNKGNFFNFVITTIHL